uniref:Uncharacterized protein n=1 Tax=Timema bartmani TaxID=61472 RepID=A0A7R9F3S4_9NEOP|nr:unnamed protein product [Timema bartmani]
MRLSTLGRHVSAGPCSRTGRTSFVYFSLDPALTMITLVPVPDLMVSFLRRTPHMHDEEYATSRFGNDPTSPLVLPDTMHRHRVLYTVSEYTPLLDSSNMSMQQWIQLAEDIKRSVGRKWKTTGPREGVYGD